MPSDPARPDFAPADAEPQLGFDVAESVDALISAETRPGDDPSAPPKNDDTATSTPAAPSYVRATSTSEAYTLLHDGTQPVAIGDYLVGSKIGQGGMGAVFKARQMNLDRDVALKVLARHLLDDEKFVHRFKREAKVMARLDHQNIIRCYDVGEELGLHYLTMEFVDGCSLQHLLEKHRRFSVGDALFVTLRVAEALRYAHELNLVHRDVKPDNVMVTKKGAVKLADLGLAKPVDDDLSMTASGTGAGTPSFMAPEQMRSAKEVDGRADIYALGAMLYLMLTGQNPFAADTLVKLLEAKEKGKPKSARKLNPQVPGKLDLMIEKMLAKSLTVRYQTCAEVIRDVQGLGLANDRFSLFHREAKADGTQKRAPAAPTSKSAAAPPASKTGQATPIETVWWYVDAGVTAEGKKRVRKLSYDQVKAQIRGGRLDATVEASRQPAAGYRALASYGEFEPCFRPQTVQGKGQRQTDSYEREGGWGRFFNTPMGWVIVLLGLAVLGGIGYVVYLFSAK